MKGFFMLALLVSTCLAVQVINQEIRIELKEGGSAYVEQEHLLRLTARERQEFESLIKGNAGFSEMEDYGIIRMVTYPSHDENLIIELTQSDFGVVTFQYSVGEIVETVEVVGKQELTGITQNAFVFFDGSTISLPYDPPTVLKISIPAELRLAREVTPPAYSVTSGFNANGKKVTYYEWNYRKPFTSAKFQVLYEHEVTLQSQLSLRTLTREFREKYGNPIYLLAGLIVLLIVAWYRKQISALITESFGGEPTLEDDEEH